MSDIAFGGAAKPGNLVPLVALLRPSSLLSQAAMIHSGNMLTTAKRPVLSVGPCRAPMLYQLAAVPLPRFDRMQASWCATAQRQ